MKIIFYMVAALTTGLYCAGGYAQDEESELAYNTQLERKEAEATCRQWAEIDEIPANELDKFLAECIADYMNEVIESDDTVE